MLFNKFYDVSGDSGGVSAELPPVVTAVPAIDSENAFRNGYGKGAETGRSGMIRCITEIKKSQNRDEATINQIGAKHLGKGWESYKELVLSLVINDNKEIEQEGFDTEKPAEKAQAQAKPSKAEAELEKLRKQHDEIAKNKKELELKLEAEEKKHERELHELTVQAELQKLDNIVGKKFIIKEYMENRSFYKDEGGKLVPAMKDGVPIYSEAGGLATIKEDFIKFVNSDEDAKTCIRANENLFKGTGYNAGNHYPGNAAYTQEQISQMAKTKDPRLKEIVKQWYAEKGYPVK